MTPQEAERVLDHHFDLEHPKFPHASEAWQTLKSPVLAAQTTNKQSTPCLCNVGVEYIPQSVRVCSNCGQPK